MSNKRGKMDFFTVFSETRSLPSTRMQACSNRSDMNAGIAVHFSPTIKSERDTWSRFVHTHRANLNPSGNFVAGVFKSISRRNTFQERFTWKAVVVGLFLAQFLQY